MISIDSAPTLREARLNALANLAEWKKLLTHFELEPDEFALIPVFVPDNDWASVCRQSLSQYLQKTTQKELYAIPVETTDDLKNLAVNIFDLESTAKFGAVWIAAPVTVSDNERKDWQAAWHEGMARLNQYRNPFRRKFDIPVLLVGAEWTKEIIRDSAPDLWSIRTIVVNIEPPVVTLSDKQINIQTTEITENLNITTERGSDPEFAMREATRLRGQKGKELNLAQLLYRAGNGFIEQRRFQPALKALEEADNLLGELISQPQTKAKQTEEKIQQDVFRADIKLDKGVSLKNLGKINEAIIEYDKVIEIRKDLVANGRTELANGLAKAYMNKGNSIQLLGKINETIIEYEKAIEIWKELVANGRTEIADTLAMAYMNKGVSLKNLGKINEAIIEYEKAVEILKDLIANGRNELANDLAMAYMNKGNSIQLLGKINEAIIEYEKAILIWKDLVEQGRTELANDLALAYMNKGSAFRGQGDDNQAEKEYDKAIKIYERLVNEENRIELTNDMAMTYWGKGNALNGLGKIKEAIDFYDKAIEFWDETLQRGEVQNLPNMAIVLGIRSDTHRKAGNPDSAEKDMRRLYQLLELTKQHKEIEHLGTYIQAQIDKRS